MPAWTESSLDQQTKKMHDEVPITRKCIVNQCLFWVDVAKRFRHNLHSKRKQNSEETDEPPFIIGIIGCGSIGSKFVKQLLKRQMIDPKHILISSRTPSRAKQRCGLEVVQNNSQVASMCTLLFLFVLPFHFRNFSREIREAIQGNRPLVISTLAGFTPLYLQRALNTPFLITTGINMHTIGAAVAHRDEEFPLESFASEPEFEEFCLVPSAYYSIHPVESQVGIIPPELSGNFQPVESSADLIGKDDPEMMRSIHEVCFSAQNIVDVGPDFISAISTALTDWLSIDPKYSAIQAKPSTFNKLWEKSFIPLHYLTRTNASGAPVDISNIGLILKKAFIRSLIVDPMECPKNMTVQGKGELQISGIPSLT